LKNLIDELKSLSGPECSPTKNIPYSTYHFENFEITQAQRNTLDRLNMFGIKNEDDFSGQNIIDFGSNLGAMALELAKRNANVIGLEFNNDRVMLTNEIAKFLKLRAEFIQCDINDFSSNIKYDIVFALSINKYMKNKVKFYNLLSETIKNVCYLESNDFNLDHFWLKDFFSEKGFVVNYLGKAKPDLSIGPLRDLFIIAKKFHYIGGVLKKDNDKYVKTYLSFDEWSKIYNAYEKIKHIKQIPMMDFSYKKIICSDLGGDVLGASKTNVNHKNQFISFMIQLNKAGYIHRDLSCNNIIINKQNLFVLDWDFVTEQKTHLINSYDITGLGSDSPRNTNNRHIFKPLKIKNMPSVAEKLNITLYDFISCL